MIRTASSDSVAKSTISINSVLIYADFVVGSSKAYHQFAFHCFGDDRMPLKEILKRLQIQTKNYRLIKM